MGNETKLTIGVRTIVVTTEVAVKSNQAAGRYDLALESARRGEALLARFASSLPPDASPHVLALSQEARQRISALIADASRRPISVGDGDGSLDEDVDVRSELRPKLP